MDQSRRSDEGRAVKNTAKGTKRVRVQLDFVLEGDEEINNLPHAMQRIGFGFIYSPSEPVVAELKKIGLTYVSPGALVTIGLDYRKPKKARKP